MLYNLYVKYHNPGLEGVEDNSRILTYYTKDDVVQFFKKLIKLEEFINKDSSSGNLTQFKDLNFEEDFDLSVQKVCEELTLLGWTLAIKKAELVKPPQLNH